MKTFHEIEIALKNYSWMVREIKRLEEELKAPNQPITGKYGVELFMSKGNKKADPVCVEVQSRERKRKILDKFKRKVQFIDTHLSFIEDDRELAILNCLLDGMSIVAISQQMGFSERKVYCIKDAIVRKMLKNAGNAEIAE